MNSHIPISRTHFWYSWFLFCMYTRYPDIVLMIPKLSWLCKCYIPIFETPQFQTLHKALRWRWWRRKSSWTGWQYPPEPEPAEGKFNFLGTIVLLGLCGAKISWRILWNIDQYFTWKVSGGTTRANSSNLDLSDKDCSKTHQCRNSIEIYIILFLPLME